MRHASQENTWTLTKVKSSFCEAWEINNRVEAWKLTAHYPKAKDKNTALYNSQNLLAHDKIWHCSHHSISYVISFGCTMMYIRWCTMMYDDVRWCTMMYVNLICCAIASFFVCSCAIASGCNRLIGRCPWWVALKAVWPVMPARRSWTSEVESSKRSTWTGLGLMGLMGLELSRTKWTYSDLVTSINESKGVCKKVKRSDSPKKST